MTVLRPAIASTGALGEARQLLRATTFGLIAALLVQFFLGMLVNLFVTTPDSHPGSRPSEYFAGSFQSVVWVITQGPLALVLHALLGLLLVLGGVRLVMHARRIHERRVLGLAVVGGCWSWARGSTGRASSTSTRTSAR